MAKAKRLPQETPSKMKFTDTRRVKELVALMSEHGLSEIELVEDKSKITLRRGWAPVAHAAPHHPVMPAPITEHAAAPSAPAVPAKAAPAEENLVAIKSPMVGTYYGSANPESDPFVAPGARITADSVVCIIEAMKVFNEIRAEMAGTIAKVLVQNGQVVEYGQPLFLVTPD